MSDRRLVVAITRGHEGALNEAYDRHGPAVLGIARRLCGETRAEDLAQEIFLALWQRPDRFDPDRGSLRTFLSLQAHHRSIDQLRSDGSRHAREHADGRLPVDTPTTTESAAIAGADRAVLDHALALLPAPQREVIALAFFGGHTYREVARLLDQPEGTVKGRIRSGLAALQLLLDDPEPDTPSLVA